jgi:hypothetical protein
MKPSLGAHLFLLLLTATVWSTQVARAQVGGRDSTAVADSLALLQLERELAAEMSGVPDADAGQPASGTTARTAPSLNPNISVIGDFRGSYTSDGDRNVDGELHEVEMSLQSVVDPYARADFYIAAGHNGEGEFDFEMEEGYLTTLSLPWQLQARAGKFRSVFGKLNRTHPHALPFIDTPAVYANFLGDEGLNDQGVSLSWLVPNGRFFQDLTVEVTRGPGESESFERHDSNRLLYVAHLKNFWDVTQSSTFELGFSGAAGPNADGMTTLLGGVDATYIWKPLQFNTYHSFTLQAESFFSWMEVEVGDPVMTWGMFVLANYQVGRRWFLIGRFDHSDLPDDPNWDENVLSGTLRWNATEFQKIEFGLRTQAANEIDRNYQFLVRAIFVIGAHGAHEY